MNTYVHKNYLNSFFSGLSLGVTISFICFKIFKYFSFKRKKIICMSEEKPDPSAEEVLVREQLKRNYEFFKEEGMNKIKESYVIVVGIGGVGR